MLIKKADRRKIHEYIFKEGVLVAQKDFNKNHDDIHVSNLVVIKLMQSMTSKGFVKTQFAWQFYYYTLTVEGVEFLRKKLNLPPEIVPATHKKAVRTPRPALRGGPGDGPRAPRDNKDEYRKREKDIAPSEFRAQYPGVGRGAPTE